MRSAAQIFGLQIIAVAGLLAAWPFLASSVAIAQTPESEAADLATSLADSIGSGDFARAGTLLAPDVVVTFQNGDVSRGREDVVKYANGMFNGQGALVQAYSGAPVVTGVATVDDSTRVVTGTSTDRMTLSSGAPMVLETRWTATIARRDGAWKIASLHLSTNMLDNPIIEKMKTTSYLLGAFGLVMGITIGIGVSMLLRRRAAPLRSIH